MLPEKPWKPEAVLRLLLGAFVCVSLGSVAVYLLLPAGALDTAPGKFLALLISSIGFHWMGLLLVAAFLREHETGWADAFGFNTPRVWRAVLLGAGAAVVIFPVAGTLLHLCAETITQLSGKPPARQFAVQAVEAAVSLDQRIYTMLLTIVLAPIVEEIFFRGILYPSVKQLGYPRLALWGTSLAFALVHSNLMVLLPLTVLALVLVWLYERTGNLLAPIVTHGLFNAANYAYMTHARAVEPVLNQIQ